MDTEVKDETMYKLKTQEVNHNDKLEIQEAIDILTRIIDESLLLWEDYKCEIEENKTFEADSINTSYRSKQLHDHTNDPIEMANSTSIDRIENEEVKDKSKIIENSIANIEETKHNENN